MIALAVASAFTVAIATVIGLVIVVFDSWWGIIPDRVIIAMIITVTPIFVTAIMVIAVLVVVVVCRFLI